VPVADVDGLEGLARRPVPEAAVGEHAVHVEDQKLDTRGTLDH
jgi:hypothetical protein